MSIVDMSRLAQQLTAVAGPNGPTGSNLPGTQEGQSFSMATSALGLKQDLHHRASSLGIEAGLLAASNERMKKILESF